MCIGHFQVLLGQTCPDGLCTNSQVTNCISDAWDQCQAGNGEQQNKNKNRNQVTNAERAKECMETRIHKFCKKVNFDWVNNNSLVQRDTLEKVKGVNLKNGFSPRCTRLRISDLHICHSYIIYTNYQKLVGNSRNYWESLLFLTCKRDTRIVRIKHLTCIFLQFSLILLLKPDC